ncbi:MAG: DUF4263 domain-containing protein [Erysipelotrichales bacterium]|nr:DUF4263 domain-containing protein [Erysipelotrichales bacterium]
MGLDLIITDSELILKYEAGSDWIEKELINVNNDNAKVSYRGFTLTKDLLRSKKLVNIIYPIFRVFSHINNEDELDDYDDWTYYFVIGDITNGLIHLRKSVFDINNEIVIDLELKLEMHHLIYAVYSVPYNKHINIIAKIDRIVNSPIAITDKYLEGFHNLPTSIYQEIVTKMPNKTELKLYAEQRIENLLAAHLDVKRTFSERFDKYISKKKIEVVETEMSSLYSYEYEKFTSIRNKLNEMLKNPKILEAEWQKEILEIILLIYPQYVYCIAEMEIRYENDRKRLDLALISANGNIDIIEIKRPYGNGIVSVNKYRSNHWPLQELSGPIMQLEKYSFYLNKLNSKQQQELSIKYSDKIGGLKLNIVNPKGIIIAGRSNNFTGDQKNDFEFMRRKYSNLIDIITYDDLLERLNNVVKSFEKKIS